VVIEGLARQARVTRSTHDTLILGFELDDGARSMADIILGKARPCPYDEQTDSTCRVCPASSMHGHACCQQAPLAGQKGYACCSQGLHQGPT
jgi:hypothetical protein